jgi:PAS domain S-box-containing protein
LRIRWWPRSIRWQMLASLVVLEVLSIGLFAAVLARQQIHRTRERAQSWLEYESTALADQSAEALEQRRPEWVDLAVRTIVESPIVQSAKIVDPSGEVLFVHGDRPESRELSPAERAQISLVKSGESTVFTTAGGNWEAVRTINTGNNLRGYAFVTFDQSAARQQLDSLLGDTAIFGVIWVVASVLLMLLLARAITRPLAVLHRGATALMTSEGEQGQFPLPVTVHNEIGDLIETFNRMVASLAEQRAGLNDTLSLLDSMLANAPIGLAFVDHGGRFVRVNRVFGDFTGVSVSRHLGRTLRDLLPHSVANEMEAAVQRVFSTEEPVRNLELNGSGGKPNRPWTWLMNAYPVRTMPNQVRWVGIIVLDASERKRSEEALRRSEKLAVTGRLAASIAHEINNPLEAITNLLFLLRNFSELPEAAQEYVTMTEYEVRRIAEITQQTLRFYRQPTQPGRTALAELLDSVLGLYQGRINTLDLRVERDYDREMSLFCFAGEIRQVFANLIGNAIDASTAGGRLIVRARRSHHWKNPGQTGVRFAIADSGCGMEPEVREHIFEAFFTTKEVTGTGLGLWVSHEIILKHNGLVRVRSRAASSDSAPATKPVGTVFQLFIPDDPNLAGAPSSTVDGAGDSLEPLPAGSGDSAALRPTHP